MEPSPGKYIQSVNIVALRASILRDLWDCFCTEITKNELSINAEDISKPDGFVYDEYEYTYSEDDELKCVDFRNFRPAPFKASSTIRAVINEYSPYCPVIAVLKYAGEKEIKTNQYGIKNMAVL